MKRIVDMSSFLVVLVWASYGHATPSDSPAPLYVYDVTEYGADAAGNTCAQNTEAIQSAIDAAHSANGGTVYFPPGWYCVSDELKGYPNITMRGATLGSIDLSAASVIFTSTEFGAGKSVIRMANRTVQNYGFQLEDMTIYVGTTNSGIVGVDFSGVWYGAIRGVSVSGGLGDDPRHVLSSGSIGFLFSDLDGESTGNASFANLVERTSVNAMDTAYRFLSATGAMSLITMTNFWVSDVVTGIWTSSVGDLGLTFRDGYMVTSLGVSGKKAFKHTSGSPSISTQNVQFENGTGSLAFDAPNDLPITSGVTTNLATDMYVGGQVYGNNFRPIVAPGDLNCGSTAACPCVQGMYPPAGSISFWASIRNGASLSAGANTFTYYTYYAAGQPVLQDLYFTFHVTHPANIGQVFQLTGTNSVTSPYGSPFQTYTITIFVPTAVTLTSDFIFFLEASTTSQQYAAGSCGYAVVE